MNEAPFHALDSDLEGQELGNDKLYVTEEICEYWRNTSRWTSNIAITGFVFCGLLILGILFSGVFSFSLPGPFIVFAVVMVFVLFFLLRNLYLYSVHIRMAADDSEWTSMETALLSMRNAVSIYGIFTAFFTLILIGFVAYLLLFQLPTILSLF